MIIIIPKSDHKYLSHFNHIWAAVEVTSTVIDEASQAFRNTADAIASAIAFFHQPQLQQEVHMKHQKAQGDVLVTKISEKDWEAMCAGANLPAALPLRKEPIVAFGEVTGHHHKVFGDGVQVLEDSANPFALWVVAPSGAELRHVDEQDVLTGEHDTIVLDAGFHRVDLQREVDLLTGAENVRVSD